MAKITYDELMSRMASFDLDEKELAEYFIIDEARSTPFNPRFKPNPATVQIPRGPDAAARSAMLLNGANQLARFNRKSKFYRKIGDGYSGPIIVSEGDSWFQYPVRLKDTIDHLMDDYAVFSLGAAGDLLERMARKGEHLKALRETGASILLMSGGGNDLVASGALASHLERYDADLAPADYLLPSFHRLLDDALTHYGQMFRQVQQAFPHVSVICHGYDYPLPDNGRWLGKPMQAQGIRSKPLQAEIAVEMMDEFNRRLRRLANAMPHVTYIDCRNVVGASRWFDELHPTDEGYDAVAQKFDHEIRRLSNTRSAPRVVVGGPFGSAADLRREMPPMPAPEIAGGGARGMSLHVGLNTVDPAHYAGWDGLLKACEADAHAMKALAEDEGFEPKMLLTAEATREAVIAGIEEAADELQAGDMFLFTVSGHGGRIPDFNHDEVHDDDANRMDETLCLYDFQLADDELFMLWTKFRAGVRILMVPDTCHSGSMVKDARVAMPTTLFGREIPALPGIRHMPQNVEDLVIRAHGAQYRATARSYAAFKEEVMTAPLTAPIRASVLNLGAAKDEQFAMDGPQHGAFTGALLKVWAGGGFTGNYRTFRDAIDREIGSTSQTPQLFDKLIRDPDFSGDRPFTLNPATRATGGVRPGPAPTPLGGSEDDDGDENDQISDAEVAAILEAKTRGVGLRNSQAALSWPDYSDFVAKVQSWNLDHFEPDEFLVLGGGHSTVGGACFGKNTYPPRHLWDNMEATAKVLDHLRKRLGKPIVITNAYRSEAYNECIGGKPGSLHKQFNAIDFKVSGMAQPDVAMALRWLRETEGRFVGGVGRYNTFTHVDTRGTMATWPSAFANAPLPGSDPLPNAASVAAKPTTLADRIAALLNIELAAPRRTRSTPKGDTAFASAVPRSGDPFDPNAALNGQQQNLQAAVNASSVISFVENLTPGQKEDVLLSTLFAQRAADKAVPDPIKNREAWYERYMEVLALMGWVTEAMPFTASQKMIGNGSFSKVILGTLAQVATGNQFKIVESAISALESLSDDDGQIKLFDFETSKVDGGNFQIGSAEAAGDVISMALGAFNFTFKDRRQNILFVSWGKNELDYWLSARKLSLSGTAYADVRETIKARLADTRKTAIMDIAI